MLHDRQLELEMLRRVIEHNQKIDPIHFYFLDIKDAVTNVKTHILNDNLHNEMWSSHELLTRSDKDIKRNVIELSNKRKITEHAKDLMKNIDNYSKLSDFINGFKLSSTTDVELVNIESVVNERLQHIFDVADGKKESAIKTDTPLDKFDGGFRNEYIIIGARPSVGKSVMGLQISVNLARKGLKGVYFSLEMSRRALVERYLYHMAKVSANNAKQLMLSNDQREKLKQAAQEIIKMGVDIIDAKCDIYDIIEKCQQNKYDFVVIDYIQKIKPHRNADRRAIVEEISQELADLPKSIHCPVFTIASLSRGDTKGGPSQRPRMSELKETGNLEYDADVIIMLHRDNPDGNYLEDCEAICAKNRNGETGITKMKIRGSVYRFDNY